MATKQAPKGTTQANPDEPAGALDDRDQSAISPERAHEKADKAEFPGTEAVRPELEDGLTARDNLEDEPDEERGGDAPS